MSSGRTNPGDWGSCKTNVEVCHTFHQLFSAPHCGGPRYWRWRSFIDFGWLHVVPSYRRSTLVAGAILRPRPPTHLAPLPKGNLSVSYRFAGCHTYSSGVTYSSDTLTLPRRGSSLPLLVLHTGATTICSLPLASWRSLLRALRDCRSPCPWVAFACHFAGGLLILSYLLSTGRLTLL